MRVSPFGNPRINGYLLLPVAYRSLSRPSSAPDAKAFPLRSFQLDLSSRKLAPFRFRFRENFISAPSLSSFAENSFSAMLETGERGTLSLRRVRENLVLLRIMQAHKDFRNCNCYPYIFSDAVPQLLLSLSTLSCGNLSVALLHTSFTLFSFQGALFQPLLKPDRNTHSMNASI